MDTNQCSGLNTNHGSPKRIRTTSSSSVVQRKIAKILGQTLFRGHPTSTKDAANLSIHNAANSSNNWVGKIMSLYNQTGFTSEFDGCEPFLRNIWIGTLPSIKYRTAMARLRTSSHSQAIEVGRFPKPRPLPVTNRLCTICDIIEDEYHFLLCVCPQYSLKRQQMETTVENLFPYYRFMSQEQKFIF